LLPKLLDSEHKLLYDNEVCLKCHHPFIAHCSHTCPNDFLEPASYKTLIQGQVDYIKHNMKKSVGAMVAPVHEDSSSANPIAVVMGMSNNPIMYMPPKASSVIEGEGDSSNSMSLSIPTAAVSRPVESLMAPLVLKDNLALLSIPHSVATVMADVFQKDLIMSEGNWLKP
jgi:hypothetical protein